MSERSYTMIHLKQGITVYIEQPTSMSELLGAKDGICCVTGIDLLEYEFLSSEVVMVHQSTPESRTKLAELRMDLQEETAAVQQARMAQLIAKQEEMQGKLDSVASTTAAVDRVSGRLGGRPQR